MGGCAATGANSWPPEEGPLAMVIGVPKEIKQGENRVALTPAGASALLNGGHRVLVERSAGQASSFSDRDYAAVGVELVDAAAEVWRRANLVVKVKEPLPDEFDHLREDLTLFTYLHLASSVELTRELLNRGVTAIAYETVQKPDGGLPLLVPMSEVAGRIAVQAGMHYLQANNGGRGILISGVPGVPPAEVVIIGGGIVGANAATLAVGLGAQVTVFDVRHDRLKYLDDVMHGRCITVYSTKAGIAKAAEYADLVVGAVLVAGSKAPIVMDDEMVQAMRPGTIIVDVAVDQGGCVSTTKPTSHSDPVYTQFGVIHYAVPNMPALVPRTSTMALTNATLPYILAIADEGVRKAVATDPSLALGVSAVGGVCTSAPVAELFGLDCAEPLSRL